MHSYVGTAIILLHRISHLEIIGSFGNCECGVEIDLRNQRTGEVMTAGGLKDRLADVYNRCTNDTHVQSVSELTEVQWLSNHIALGFLIRSS